MVRKFLPSVLAAIALTGPVAAENYSIKAIKYKNNGAYNAFFGIELQGTRGTYPCEGSNTKGSGIKSGKSITIQLDNSDGSLISTADDDCTPHLGQEIWGVVYIDRGAGWSPAVNEQSCRKDNTKFYYDPAGGTLVVKSKGTTENGNRCRLVDKGNVHYIGPIE
ncbi:MAG: hypothetical protein NXH72_08225 [Hyphomonadaceae bacterium]|nr:hypothetical protein [Hyphomonadaceae bacterium]